jgi:hypothetical protein
MNLYNSSGDLQYLEVPRIVPGTDVAIFDADFMQLTVWAEVSNSWIVYWGSNAIIRSGRATYRATIHPIEGELPIITFLWIDIPSDLIVGSGVDISMNLWE